MSLIFYTRISENHIFFPLFSTIIVNEKYYENIELIIVIFDLLLLIG